MTVAHHADKFHEALAALAGLSISVRSLQAQLAPYALKDDPFSAMLRAHIEAEIYEINQESHIYEGPPGK